MPRNPLLDPNLVPFQGTAKRAQEEPPPPPVEAEFDVGLPSGGVGPGGVIQSAADRESLELAELRDRKEGVDYVNIPLKGEGGIRLREWRLPLSDELISRGYDASDPIAFANHLQERSTPETYQRLYEEGTALEAQPASSTRSWRSEPFDPGTGGLARHAKGFAGGLAQALWPGATEGQPWFGPETPSLEIEDRGEMNPAFFGGEGWRKHYRLIGIEPPEMGRNIDSGAVLSMSDVSQLSPEDQKNYKRITGDDPDALLPSQQRANRERFEEGLSRILGPLSYLGPLPGNPVVAKFMQVIWESSVKQQLEYFGRFLKAAEEGDKSDMGWNFASIMAGPFGYLMGSFETDFVEGEVGRAAGKFVGLGGSGVVRGALGLVPRVGARAAGIIPSLSSVIGKGLEFLRVNIPIIGHAAKVKRFPGRAELPYSGSELQRTTSGAAGAKQEVMIPGGGPGYIGRLEGVWELSGQMARGVVTTGGRYRAKFNKAAQEMAGEVQLLMDDFLDMAFRKLPKSKSSPALTMTSAEARQLNRADFATDVLGPMLTAAKAKWATYWKKLYGEQMLPILKEASKAGLKTRSNNLIAKANELLEDLRLMDESVRPPGVQSILEKYATVNPEAGWRSATEIRSIYKSIGEAGARLQRAGKESDAAKLFALSKAGRADYSDGIAHVGKLWADRINLTYNNKAVSFQEFERLIRQENAFTQTLLESQVLRRWMSGLGHERIGDEIWSAATTTEHIRAIQDYMGPWFRPVAYHSMLGKFREFFPTATPTSFQKLVPSLENMQKQFVGFDGHKLKTFMDVDRNYVKMETIFGEARTGILYEVSTLLKRMDLHMESGANAALNKGAKNKAFLESPVGLASVFGLGGGVTGGGTGGLAGAAFGAGSWLVLTEGMLRFATGPKTVSLLKSVTAAMEAGDIGMVAVASARLYEERDRVLGPYLQKLGMTGPDATFSPQTSQLIDTSFLQNSIQPPPLAPGDLGWRRGRQ